MAPQKKLSVTFITSLLLCGCAVNPDALTQAKLDEFAETQKSELARTDVPVSGPVSLDEAIARAIKYNLDHRVEQIAASVAIANLELANWDMLPKVVAGTNYFGRNNDQGSRSRSLITGNQSLEYSTSTDREHTASDLTFSYNILDFGLSYVRAQQAADKALIAEEQRRKALLRIIEDTRTAYWRAISAERLVTRMRVLESDVQRALRNTRTLARGGMASPLPALTYERELVAIKRELQALERNLIVAKQQLGALINIRPGQPFRIVTPNHRPVPAILSVPSSEMIDIALRNRPEVRQIIYDLRITQKDATAALLELLPGIQVFAGPNTDTNSYLFKGDWISWGARASWNVLRLFSYPARRRQNDMREDLTRQRGLALTMAIMTQIHISRAKYANLAKEFRTAGEFVAVQRRVLRQVRGETAAERSSQQNLIRERMNTIVAEAKYDIAYADLQNAYGNILAATGVDIIEPEIARTASIADLTRHVRETLAGAKVQRVASR